MEKWIASNRDAVLELLPIIEDQLNGMSRIKWELRQGLVVAQGFPKRSILCVGVHPVPMYRGLWVPYFKYYSHDNKVAMTISVHDMDDLIAVFKGWLVIFESDMPPGVQQQMEL